jgi:hypothetical protein
VKTALNFHCSMAGLVCIFSGGFYIYVHIYIFLKFSNYMHCCTTCKFYVYKVLYIFVYLLLRIFVVMYTYVYKNIHSCHFRSFLKLRKKRDEVYYCEQICEKIF